MIKRTKKITSLLLAAAAVASLTPTIGANASQKLETQDGNIENAIAFNNRDYVYQGYKDNGNDAVYYNDGQKDKLLENIESTDIKGEYAEKYAYALDANDQYLVDLSNGNVTDSETPEDAADTASINLKTALKKTDRYGNNLTVTASNLAYNDTNGGAIPGNKFGETWYQYTLIPSLNKSDTKANVVNNNLYGFTNGKGNYIDTCNIANIYAYSSEKGKTVNIAKFSNNTNDVDKTTKLLATLTDKPTVLTQDKDYIYTMVTVKVTDTSAKSTTTTTLHTYIQKISKATRTEN